MSAKHVPTHLTHDVASSKRPSARWPPGIMVIASCLAACGRLALLSTPTGAAGSAPSTGSGGAAGSSEVGGHSSAGTDGSSAGTAGSSTLDASDGPASATDGGDALMSRRVPRRHRASPAPCVALRPAGGCPLDTTSPASPCFEDSQCNDGGISGRCSVHPGDSWCWCAYSDCASDSDCQTGGPCDCTSPASPDDGDTSSVCHFGHCRVDADCGAGGFCSPTPIVPCFRSAGTGYECHTPRDTCLDDEDCDFTKNERCLFDTLTASWACAAFGCAQG